MRVQMRTMEMMFTGETEQLYVAGTIISLHLATGGTTAGNGALGAGASAGTLADGVLTFGQPSPMLTQQ